MTSGALAAKIDALGVGEMRINKRALRWRAIEVVVSESVDIAEPAEQMSAFRRADDPKWAPSPPPPVVERPPQVFPAAHRARIGGRPNPIPGGEQHMVGVEGIDLDIAHPMRVERPGIRRRRVIPFRIYQQGNPGLAGIRAAVDLVALIKAARDHRARMPRVDGHRA